MIQARQFFRRTFDSLESPTYRPFFATLVIGMAGFWMRIATVGWLVYEITSSHELLGLVTAAALAPFVVAAPWGGSLADKIDERRVIAIVLAGVFLLNVGLGVWLLFHAARIEHIVAYSIAVGFLRGVEVPARHALAVRLVKPERVHNAVGLNAACFHFTAAFGPVLAGTLYHFAGPAPCFFVIAATALPLAIVAPRLRPRARRVEPAPDVPPSARSELTAGFRYVYSHSLTRALILAAALSVALLWSFRTLMPAVARDVLLLDEVGYGLLMGLTGVGSFCGALAVASGATRRLIDPRSLLRFVGVGAVAVGLVGIARTPWVAGLGLFVAGFCHVAFMASGNTLVQLSVPDRLRARVMGVWALSFGICWPVGSLLMGWLAGLGTTTLALLVCPGAALVWVVLLYAGARIGRRAGAERAVPGVEPLDAAGSGL